MTDIFTRIKEDHDTARDLMTQIQNTGNGAAKTRAELFEKFKLEMWTHNKIEEATFYSKLESKGETAEALEAKNEHHVAGAMIEELDMMPKDSEAWEQKFKALCEVLEHHMDEEEGEFFDLGRKEFTKEEAERLGERFDARKKVVVPALERVES